MVGPGRPQFVLFGSSIVQFSFGDGGWGASLADLYARKVFFLLLVEEKFNVIANSRRGTEFLRSFRCPVYADIILRGYSGWNSRLALEVLEKVFPKDAATQPSLVIVYFGGNDSVRPHPSGLGPHVPLPEYVENMRKIAKHLKSLSDCTRVIFLSAPPVNEEQIRESWSDKNQELRRTNELCRVYSEACIKLCREMNIKAVDLWTAMQKRDDWATACFTDGIHFSPEGSEIVVEEILRVLKEADWKPSLYWESMPTEFGEDSPY